jgi:NitT/TauT family transport system substrate-binding protein
MSKQWRFTQTFRTRTLCRKSVFVVAFVFLVVSFAFSMPTKVPAMEVVAAFQPGLTYLPFHMMKRYKLVESIAKKAGVEDVTMKWVSFGSGAAMNDALLSKTVHFAASGAPPAIIIWGKTWGNPNYDIRGVAGYSNMFQYLITNQPHIKSLKDFTDKDKIALPAVKVSVQAIELQIACSKIWGTENYDKLDHLTVSMQHPEAMAALLSGKGEITAHFTNAPFQFMELKDPRCHLVLNSRDALDGPHSNSILVAPNSFREKNPKIYRVFIDAMEMAIAMIKADKRRAAQVYIEEEKSKEDLNFIVEMLESPDITFSTTPLKTKVFADFMYERGQIKVKPKSWKDLFFPEIHDKDGS